MGGRLLLLFAFLHEALGFLAWPLPLRSAPTLGARCRCTVDSASMPHASLNTLSSPQPASRAPRHGRTQLAAAGQRAGDEEWEDISGDGGCLKQVVAAGTGSGDECRPRKGSIVTLHYEIHVDGELLDTSRGPDNEAFEFELGMEPSDAIAGWECAIPTMREGETARLRCGPAYAFGPAGSPPKIPPNATVDCTLQLLSWVDKTAKWTALADQYTDSEAPEEDVYNKYKEDIAVCRVYEVW